MSYLATRKLITCLSVCGVILLAVPAETKAVEPWAHLGLASLQPIDDLQGEQIRGASSASGASGLSFLSAMLFDPSTGSSMQASTVSSTGSSQQGTLTTVGSQQQQLSQLGFSLEINSGLGSFSGTVGGIAGGFGMAGFVNGGWGAP